MERWSNGDLAVPVSVHDGLWRIFVSFDEQWIRLRAAVTTLPPEAPPEALLSYLSWNAEDRLTRAAVVEGRLSICADYPVLDFIDSGFVHMMKAMVESVRQLVVRYGFDASSAEASDE
ncbi:hypothetical protein [Sorangium sp. So ce1389]|uniref:hypothetical protein n=1 Tax=Sorangium sp. So ce1389 TaxID=3133336 RepID=UPI003F611459